MMALQKVILRTTLSNFERRFRRSLALKISYSLRAQTQFMEFGRANSESQNCPRKEQNWTFHEAMIYDLKSTAYKGPMLCSYPKVKDLGMWEGKIL